MSSEIITPENVDIDPEDQAMLDRELARKKQDKPTLAAAPGLDAEDAEMLERELVRKQERTDRIAPLKVGNAVDPDDFAKGRKLALDYGVLPFIPEDPTARNIMQKRLDDENLALWAENPVNKKSVEWLSRTPENAKIASDQRDNMTRWAEASEEITRKLAHRAMLGYGEMLDGFSRRSFGENAEYLRDVALQVVPFMPDPQPPLSDDPGERLAQLQGRMRTVDMIAGEAAIGPAAPALGAGSVAELPDEAHRQIELGSLLVDIADLSSQKYLPGLGGISPEQQALLTQFKSKQAALAQQGSPFEGSAAQDLLGTLQQFPIQWNTIQRQGKNALAVASALAITDKALGVVRGAPAATAVATAGRSAIRKYGTKWIAYSATTGAATAIFMLEFGSMIDEVNDTVPATPEFPDDHPLRVYPAIAAATFSSSFEFLSEMILQKPATGRLVKSEFRDAIQQRVISMLRGDSSSKLAQLAATIPIEGGTEGIQEFGAVALVEFVKILAGASTVDEALDEFFSESTWERLTEAAKAGAIAGPVIGGAFHSAGFVLGKAISSIGSSGPGSNTPTIREMVPALQELLSDLKTELGGRDSEMLKDYLNTTSEGGLDTIRIDAETLQIMFSSAELTEEEFFGALPEADAAIARQQYEAALDPDAGGGDVEISLGAYAVGLLDTKANEALLPHIRLDDLQASEAEQAEALKIATANDEKVIDRIQTAEAEATARTAQINDIAKRVTAELAVAAPQFSRSDHRINGLLYGRMITRMAERSKMSVDELMQRVGPVVFLEDGAAGPGASGAPQLQPVFHGTPHRFDKFTLDHIGTGEGAQAFGWGLYFASRRAVAEYYREQLSASRGKHIEIRIPGGGIRVLDGVQSLYGHNLSAESLGAWFGVDIDTSNRIRELLSEFMLATTTDLMGFLGEMSDGRGAGFHRHFGAAMDALRESGVEIIEDTGQLFEVDIPESDQLLDWDLPMDAQPEGVKAKLKEAQIAGIFANGEASSLSLLLEDLSSEEIARILSQNDPNGDFELEGDLIESLGGEFNEETEQFDVTPQALDNWREMLIDIAHQENEDGSFLEYLTGEIFDPESAQSGSGLYRQITTRLGSDQAASRALLAAGIPGLQYTEGQLSGGGGTAKNFVIWDEEAISVLNTFFQPDETGAQSPRGSFSPGVSGAPNIIRIGKNANLSTFLHETLGHYMTHILQTLAESANAPSQIRDDWQTLRNYLELDEGQAIVDEAELAEAMSAWNDAQASGDAAAIRAAEELVNNANRHLEKLARAMEQYLREGKAPTRELKGAFRRAAAWLQEIYQDLKRLTGAELPQDVNDVFDRVFASDEEIAVAQSELGGGRSYPARPPQGVSAAEWEDYQRRADERFAAYRESLLKKKTKEEKRIQKAILEADREELTTLTRAVLRKSRIHQARQWLANGTWIGALGGSPITEHRKLDPTLIENDFGSDALSRLPRHRNGVIAGKKAGGLDYEDVAAAFGLSPQELIDGLTVTPLFEDAVKRSVSDAIANKAAMLGTPEQNAMDSLHDVEEAANFIVYEIKLARQWSKAMGQNPVAEDQVAEEGAGTAGERNEAVTAAQAQVDEAMAALEEAVAAGVAEDIEAAKQLVSEALFGVQQAEARNQVAKPVRKAERASRRQVRMLKVQQKKMREDADAFVRRIPLSQLRPNRFSSAERRAAEKSRRAVAARDPQAAEQALLDQLFNHFAYRSAKQVQIEVGKVKALAQRKMKPKPLGTIKKGDKEIHDWVVSMAVRSQLVNRKQIPKTATREQTAEEIAAAQFAQRNDARIVGGNRIVPDPEVSLSALVQRLEDEQNQIVFDPLAIERALETGDFKLMSSNEVAEIGRAIQQLAHIAGDELTVKMGEKELPYEIAKNNMLAQAYKTNAVAPDLQPGEIVDHSKNRTRDKIERGLRTYRAIQTKVSTLAYILDGGTPNGPNQQFWATWASEAQFREHEIKDDIGSTLHDIFHEDIFTKPEMAEFNVSKYSVPEVQRRFSMEELLVIVLQLGNEYNTQAMREGFQYYEKSTGPLTDEQLRAILALPVFEDGRLFDAAERIGEMLESYKEEAFDVEERATFVRPEVVETRPYTLPNGRVLKGWYYPLERDPETMSVAEQKEVENLKDLGGLHRGGAVTKHGFLKGRRGFGQNAVRLSLATLYEHVNALSHDIAQREFVLAAYKLSHDSEYVKMMQDLNRREDLRAMQDWVVNLAGASTVHLGPVSQFFARRRKNASVSILGASISTLAIQGFAFMDGMARTGGGNMRLAAKLFLNDFHNTLEFAMQNSTALPFRVSKMQREIAEVDAKLSPEWRKNEFNQWALQWIGKLDLIPTTLTWQAAYLQAYNDLSETRGDHSGSVAYADRLTETTQNAATPKDLASIFFRKDETAQWITWFGGFLNARLNSMYELYADTFAFHRISKFEFANKIFLAVVLQSYLASIVRGSFPRSDDDDEYKWPKWFVTTPLEEGLGSFLGGRYVADALVGTFGTRSHPAVEGGQRVLKSSKQLMESLVEGELEGTAGQRIFQVADPAVDALTAWMTWQGYAGPVQIQREMAVWEKFINGEYNFNEPETIPEFAWDVMFGPK